MLPPKSKKNDGRTSDLAFLWMLTTLGAEWRQWQELAAKWMATQTLGISDKREALGRFFESYIAVYAPYAISDLSLFFKGYQGHKCSSEEFEQIIRSTVAASANIQKGMNYAYEFIDFVVKDVFSEKDNYDNLVPLVLNPLRKIKKGYVATETVRNPLPYRYIQNLRQILCPLPVTCPHD